MRYGLLIPARNEATALPLLFERLDELAAGSRPWVTLVVDNGSTDGTAEVARRLGARVVSEPRPGYGQACLAGIDALRQSGPPDILVFLDADDLTAPAHLGELLGPIERDEADLVVGERVPSTANRGVRWHARLGNRLVLSILRWRYGSRVRDMGPFRAIRWETLEGLRLDDRSYGWYVQMQVRALREEYRVVGRPVEFERRTVGVSKISGDPIASARAGWIMLRTLARELLRSGTTDRPRAKKAD